MVPVEMIYHSKIEPRQTIFFCCSIAGWDLIDQRPTSRHNPNRREDIILPAIVLPIPAKRLEAKCTNEYSHAQ